MKRHTFLQLCNLDCPEYVAVVVEREQVDVLRLANPEAAYHYRLVSSPSFCKCKAPIHIVEPSQQELKDAWNLPEAEAI